MKNAVIRNARLLFKNFEGRADQYNTQGNREFTVVLDEPQARELAELGWNVKFKETPDGDVVGRLKVAVKFGYHPPRAVLHEGEKTTELDEDTIYTLDYLVADKVDLVLNPYEWTVNGKSGVKAYLKTIHYTVEEDELAGDYL